MPTSFWFVWGSVAYSALQNSTQAKKKTTAAFSLRGNSLPACENPQNVVSYSFLLFGAIYQGARRSVGTSRLWPKAESPVPNVKVCAERRWRDWRSTWRTADWWAPAAVSLSKHMLAGLWHVCDGSPLFLDRNRSPVSTVGSSSSPPQGWSITSWLITASW